MWLYAIDGWTTARDPWAGQYPQRAIYALHKHWAIKQQEKRLYLVHREHIYLQYKLHGDSCIVAWVSAGGPLWGTWPAWGSRSVYKSSTNLL